MTCKSFGRVISLSAAILVGTCSAQAGNAVSKIPEIKVGALTTLPQGPGQGLKDEGCSTLTVEPKTAAGRVVREHGWAVTSEAKIEDFILVGFAGELIHGTSGSCAVRQGNIGVFEGSRLTVVMYTSHDADELIGRLATLEDGAVRLWSGGFLKYPVADIVAGSAGLVVQAVASEDAWCDGKVTVPNVFGAAITAAREKLLASGWKPTEQPRLEFGQQPGLHDIGLVEAVDCSGTGFGFCAYAYKGQGASLQVTTVGGLGEDSRPGGKVTDYSVNCDL